ncbi:MAG: tetratricopeptide repeat protein, partial [Planctomycetales bacterium]|nr:tetratricopeptide repeat protein [Planctomycetales bacterium]
VLGDEPIDIVWRRAEDLLVSEEPAAALRLFRRLLLRTPQDPDGELLYRVGVCQEQMGDFEGALVAYRELVGKGPGRLTMAAKLAQARLRYRQQRYQLAEPMLYDLYFHIGPADHLRDTFHGELVHLLAQCRVAQVMGEPQMNLLDPRAVVRGAPQWNGQRLLELAQASPPDPSQTAWKPLVSTIYRFSDAPDQVEMEATIPPATVVEAVHQLAAEAGYAVNWSGEARVAVGERVTSMRGLTTSFGEMLDGLLRPCDMMWIANGKTIEIKLMQEVADSELRQYEMRSSDRCLRHAVAAFSRHPLTSVAFLALGNLDMLNGQWQQAELDYRQIVERQDDRSVRAEGLFNLGKVLWIQGNREEAKSGFYRVVDESRGHPLEALGYLFAGRITLEDGFATDAVRPLLRAVSLSTDPNVHANALLCLAGAYLLAGNPYAANETLMEDKQLLRTPQFRDQAAFLTALANYRVVKDESRELVVGRTLVTAISKAHPESFFGDHAYLLFGKTFHDLGLWEDMVALYEHALRRELTPNVRDQVRMELIKYQFTFGQWQQARAELVALAQSENTSIVRSAKLQLADLELKSERYDEVLSVCNDLLNDELDDDEKKAVLQFMGKTYQRRGDYHSAAICFSGMAPVEPATSVDPVAGGQQ